MLGVNQTLALLVQSRTRSLSLLLRHYGHRNMLITKILTGSSHLEKPHRHVPRSGPRSFTSGLERSTQEHLTVLYWQAWFGQQLVPRHTWLDQIPTIYGHWYPPHTKPCRRRSWHLKDTQAPETLQPLHRVVSPVPMRWVMHKYIIGLAKPPSFQHLSTKPIIHCKISSTMQAMCS